SLEYAVALRGQTQAVLPPILRRPNAPNQPAARQAVKRECERRLVHAQAFAEAILTEIGVLVDEHEQRKLSRSELGGRCAAHEVFEEGHLSTAQPVPDELTQCSDVERGPCLAECSRGHGWFSMGGRRRAWQRRRQAARP